MNCSESPSVLETAVFEGGLFFDNSTSSEDGPTALKFSMMTHGLPDVPKVIT